jgi:virginiamycin A acetyltransferase
LKAIIDHPRIDIGDYTYASDFDPPSDPLDWQGRLAPYIFPFSQERPIIGKFGQLAHGVRFLTASANHTMDGFSTYPFAIFDPNRLMAYPQTLPAGRDTVIGHDVWIGMNAIILPGRHDRQWRDRRGGGRCELICARLCHRVRQSG